MIQFPEKITEDLIKNHLFKGDVLFWENYQFKNGSKKTSRFIILTECKNDTFLAIRATAHTDFYEKSSGIYREFIKLSADEDPLFLKPTVFDLNSIYILTVEKMKKLFGEQIKHPYRASNSVLDKLEEIIRNSKTLRKDWVDWILNSKKSEL